MLVTFAVLHTGKTLKRLTSKNIPDMVVRRPVFQAGKNLVKTLRIQKHGGHAGDTPRVPRRPNLVKTLRIHKHIRHIGDVCCVPRTQVAVKTRIPKHCVHAGDGTGVYRVQPQRWRLIVLEHALTIAVQGDRSCQEAHMRQPYGRQAQRPHSHERRDRMGSIGVVEQDHQLGQGDPTFHRVISGGNDRVGHITRHERCWRWLTSSASERDSGVVVRALFGVVLRFLDVYIVFGFGIVRFWLVINFLGFGHALIVYMEQFYFHQLLPAWDAGR
jgi:hypothetical protein